MPRYELSEGTSNKFWEIALDGASFTTAWGRIGTAGQSTVKAFDSEAKARVEHDKLVAEKVKKGYSLVGDAGPAASPKATPAPAPKPKPKTPTPPVATPDVSAPAAQPAAPAHPAATPGQVAIVWPGAFATRAKKQAQALEVTRRTAEPADKVFAALHSAFMRGTKEALEQGLVQSNGQHEPIKRLLRIYTNEKPPSTFDAQAEGFALMLAPHVTHLTTGPQPRLTELLVESWIARGGPSALVEALAASFGPYSVNVRTYPAPPAVWVVASTEREQWTYLQGGLDRTIRGLLQGADPAQVAAAKKVAEDLRAAGDLAVRSGLSCIFLDPEWIERDIDERVRTGAPWVFTEELFFAASPQTLARWLTQMSQLEAQYQVVSEYAFTHGSRSLECFALALLARHGDATIEPLSAWLKRLAQLFRPDDWANRRLLHLITELLETLSCIKNHVAVADAAVEILDHLAGAKLSKAEDPRPAAIDCLLSSPAIALASVRDAAKGKAGGWARELLPRLERLATGGSKAEEASPDELPALLKGKVSFKAPSFWKADAFAQPLLRSNKALPGSAIDALGALLSKAERADALDEIKEVCTSQSLAAFGWDLFQAWLTAGAPNKDKWAFMALGHLGDDAAARKLTPLIRAWPGESAHQRAVLGLDVLATIGTDVALMMLNGVAQKVKFKALQERAGEKMNEIAARRGLTADELADRLVPDLGLDDDGSLVLDFGPRSFRVGFDEMLSPFVTDASGARLKDLPKPNAKDEAETASQAADTWKAMKKDAKALSGIQLLRLELAMGNTRRWIARDFDTFLVHHPLLVHLVRRLVWGTFDDEGKLGQTFRVAEDRTYADRSDEPFTLPDDARVGVAHRLHLADTDAAAWSQVFRDYEIAQPFEQLDRQVYTGEDLHRFDSRQVDTKKMMGLLSRGWHKGPAEDNGTVWELYKPISRDLRATLGISGINVSSMDYTEPVQELGGVTFSGGPIDPIVMSEVARDLASLGEHEDEAEEDET